MQLPWSCFGNPRFTVTRSAEKARTENCSSIQALLGDALFRLPRSRGSALLAVSVAIHIARRGSGPSGWADRNRILRRGSGRRLRRRRRGDRLGYFIVDRYRTGRTDRCETHENLLSIFPFGCPAEDLRIPPQYDKEFTFQPLGRSASFPAHQRRAHGTTPHPFAYSTHRTTRRYPLPTPSDKLNPRLG